MSGGYRIELSLRKVAATNEEDRIRRLPSYENPAVMVWSDEPILSLGNDGVILGHLFRRGPPSQRVRQLDERELARLRASQGRSILTDYWGSYVMVRVEPEGNVRVFRDPSGGLPCYLRRDTHTVILSDDIIEIASRGPASVNYVEIARLLGSMDAPGRQTCVGDIEELIAGECLRVVEAQTAIEQWWSPWDHVHRPRNVGFAEAAECLRDLLLDTVGAWAMCFDRILLGVSGGLDSSIVAAAASRSAPDLACLTLVGPDPEGDERRYAQCLTDSLGLPLTEASYSLADIDVLRAPAPHHPWPNAGYFKQSIEMIHDRLQRELAVGAHFSGNGGDGIFFGTRSALPFLDRLLTEGPRLALAETLRDLSDLTGADARTILRHGWARYRNSRGRHPLRFDMSAISEKFAAQIRESSSHHPWLAFPDGALPGKTTHVAFLLRSHRSLELYRRTLAPPHIAPLLAQPIVEFCLSIPTWYWVMGGLNRAVARAAFAEILPETILRRSLKGGPGGFNLAIYRQNAAALHTLLRDGRLVQAGVVEPSFLGLPYEPSWRGIEHMQRILSLGAVEAWVRWWSADSD